MFVDLRNKYESWVLDILKYNSPENLVKTMVAAIVKPALECAEKFTIRKNQDLVTRRVSEFK